MPDMSQIHPNNHDNTYTKLEKLRRSDMHVRGKMHGGFRVVTDTVVFDRCSRCDKELTGAHTIICGASYCNNCW